ncbi:MAG TPA: hypothetical protein VIS07_18855 [Candidatus Binatia bacterium]
MTIRDRSAGRPKDLVEHLRRYPEDLKDIRRLQRRFDLSADEAARALEASVAPESGQQRLKRLLTH